jgi:hypothetical protein
MNEPGTYELLYILRSKRFLFITNKQIKKQAKKQTKQHCKSLPVQVVLIIIEI